jgi:hypothetical protein
MYCQSCGTFMQEGVFACPKCGTPRPQPQGQPAEAGRFKTASADAVEALKLFTKNPVGGLPAAYERLNEPRAIGVGIAFAVIYLLCWLAFLYIAFDTRPEGIEGIVKFILGGAVPFAGFWGASALARKIFNGTGSMGGDCFIAGAALLPLGFYIVLAGILGINNATVIVALGVFALVFTILILFTGCTRISKISEEKSALAVPVMLLVSAWLMDIIYNALFGAKLLGPALRSLTSG